MAQAETVSRRSHDIDTQVGGVLIKNSTWTIISTGHNGFIRGADDDNLPNTRPDKYPYMIHAEENIITDCARHGKSTDDTTLIITMSPCVSCLRLMYQAGVNDIIFKTKYKDYKDNLSMRDLLVTETTTDEGFIKLHCEPR